MKATLVVKEKEEEVKQINLFSGDWINLGIVKEHDWQYVMVTSWLCSRKYNLVNHKGNRMFADDKDNMDQVKSYLDSNYKDWKLVNNIEIHII